MYEEAIKVSKKAVDLVEGSTLWLANLGMCCGFSGNSKSAERIIEKLQETRKTGFVAPLQFAWIYLGLGRQEEALDWLEKACDERSGLAHLIKNFPIYRSLRGRSRFQKICKRIGPASSGTGSAKIL